jgi:superfamily I DNA and RNA helicase
MLIDESQDYPESFFDLCNLVTKETVYIAGDIFQSIFDETIAESISPDYLLSKCYRTDPRTLMFAHALGMGLFEDKKLRWLEDAEWELCGYLVEKDEKGVYRLKRDPLRRFEDIDKDTFPSVQLAKIPGDFYTNAADNITSILQRIISENPSVTVDDVGIIIMDRNDDTYVLADKLEQLLPRIIGWPVNKAHESKRKVKGSLFISNRNNVKGLEFPFVICVTQRIFDSYAYRNSLYMTLTRSFLQSYIVLAEEANAEILPKIEAGLSAINSNGFIEVKEPTEEEKKRIKTTIKHSDSSMSFYDFTTKIFDDIGVLPILRPDLLDALRKVVGEEFDYERVKEIAAFNYEKMQQRDL